MRLRAASIVLMGLVVGANCSVQKKCCTCVAGGVELQIQQSNQIGLPLGQSECPSLCDKKTNARSIGLRTCDPILLKRKIPKPPPPPDTHCLSYWRPGCQYTKGCDVGDCKGNQWIQCDLTIKLVSHKVVAGHPATFQFFNDNLGQEYRGESHASRTRMTLDGSIDWGDSTPKRKLDTGRHRFPHRYENPGTYIIKAEIHGDFLWVNPHEGKFLEAPDVGFKGSSCSYSARTAPASLTVVVSAPTPTEEKKPDK